MIGHAALHLLIGYPFLLGQDLLGEGEVEGALHSVGAVIEDRRRDPSERLLHLGRLIQAVIVVQTCW